MAKRKKSDKHGEKQVEQLNQAEQPVSADNGDATATSSDDAAESSSAGGEETRRVNFNMPKWLIDAIDKEARHLAIPRQSVAIMWLADRARQENLEN